VPRRRSTTGPKKYSAILFTAICVKPPWAKIAVSHVQTYSGCCVERTNTDRHREDPGGMPNKKGKMRNCIANVTHINARKTLVIPPGKKLITPSVEICRPSVDFTRLSTPFSA
jgi:hypothetical protein